MYEQNYNEFVRKFKFDFPKADDAEIKNFRRIYFTPDFNKKGHSKGTFIFDNNKILRYAFIGNYLKTFNDHEYGWLIENNDTNLHFS